MNLIKIGIKNLKSNILLMISAIIFSSLLFLVLDNIKSIFIVTIIFISISCIKLFKYEVNIINNRYSIFSFSLILILSLKFYDIYKYSSMIQSVSNIFYMSKEIFLILILLMIGIFSIFFMNNFIVIINEEFQIICEVKNVLKKMCSKKNILKKYYLIIFLIYLISILAIIRGNINYADDWQRIYSGLPAWENFSRYLSNFLSEVLNTNYYLTDISPLTQIIAISFISLGSIIIIYVFKQSDNFNIFYCISILPLGLSPYFLQCISYKFDAPYMSLSILSSIAPLLFYKCKSKTYVFITCIFILISCLTYQASLGILPMLIIFLCYMLWLNYRDLQPIVYIFINSGLGYILGIIIYKVLFVKPITQDYVNDELFSLFKMPYGVWNNFMKYCQHVIQDFEFIWIVSTIILMVIFVCKFKKENIISSIFVLFLTFFISFGLYLAFQKPLFDCRAMYGVGVWISIISIVCINEKKMYANIVSLYLSYCFISFSFMYGNALVEQQRYINFRTNMLMSELNTLPEFYSKGVKKIKFDGTIGRSPIIDKMPQSNKVLNRLLVVTFGVGEWLENNEFTLNYFDLKKIEIDYKLNGENLPILKESYYSIIKGNHEKIYVYLKTY